MLQIDLFAWANSSQAFFALSIILPFWPSTFCPCLLTCYQVCLTEDVEKSEQSACYVVSDELNVMFPIHVLFLYRLSGLQDCFCNKRLLSCRFHFKCTRWTFNFLGRFHRKRLVNYTRKINKKIVTEPVYLVDS